METTLYFDTLKVTLQNQEFIYYRIGSKVFNLFYQIHDLVSFNEQVNLKNATIEVTSSIKLNPIFSTSLITNGRNKVLSTADYINKEVRSSGAYSNLPDSTNDEILVRALLAAQSSDVKVYKIDGIKVLG